jgi:hypothetical protein
MYKRDCHGFSHISSLLAVADAIEKVAEVERNKPIGIEIKKLGRTDDGYLANLEITFTGDKDSPRKFTEDLALEDSTPSLDGDGSSNRKTRTRQKEKLRALFQDSFVHDYLVDRDLSLEEQMFIDFEAAKIERRTRIMFQQILEKDEGADIEINPNDVNEPDHDAPRKTPEPERKAKNTRDLDYD